MNYRHWIAHFRANKNDRPEPDWSATFSLTGEKLRLLRKSLAEYQLGDGGGECCLVAADAETYRGASDDAQAVVDAWFAEEREHSRLLGCAVRRIGGEFITSTPAFRLFYAIRRTLGVQFEMLVLLIVEIVSTGYYRVLRRQVGDEPIAAMCQLILRDEARHIDFHRDRLAARHPRGMRALWKAQFHLLGHACAWFLWLGHGRCLRAWGGTRAELFAHIFSGQRNFLAELAERSQPRAAVTACASLSAS